MPKYKIVFKEKGQEDLFIEADDFRATGELIYFFKESDEVVAVIPLDHLLSVVLEADSDLWS